MPLTRTHSLPALSGGLLALAAAVLFGLTTPLLQSVGRGVGPLTTACLLYAGAALTGWLTRQPPQREARLRCADLPLLLGLVCAGAVVAPVALAWDLQRTSATSASLMLTLEALFTAGFARLCFGETMDRRVLVAMGLLLLGGLVLIVDSARPGTLHLAGLSAVLLATVAWGLDNALSRGLAERDPSQVVLAKASLGASTTALVAWLVGESWPAPEVVLALLALGASGYGLSLRLYLLAQRHFGAARTGSVFAFAPFIGAALAIAMGERLPSGPLIVGAVLMLAGVWIHLAERHEHEHVHGLQEHEHAHTHDDGHHDHDHSPMPEVPHSHWHRHEPMSHRHAHAPDAHHQHAH